LQNCMSDLQRCVLRRNIHLRYIALHNSGGKEESSVMMKIYGKTNRHQAIEGTASQALATLQVVMEKIEATGQSTAVERKTLGDLQEALEKAWQAKALHF